jgi:transcriptional regulator
MYLPTHFAENRTDVLHALMCDHPLATVIQHGQEGLVANHIPLQLAPESSDAPLGILQGHVARANPFWQSDAATTEVLVIFQGPQAYISPTWYPSKAEHGKVVPTWNYVAVHARGRLVVRDDREWLQAFLDRLVATHESEAQSTWTMSDAPTDYVEKMLAAIVGFEIHITELIGKWKVSQNRSTADRAGVADELNVANETLSRAMGELVRP